MCAPGLEARRDESDRRGTREHRARTIAIVAGRFQDAAGRVELPGLDSKSRGGQLESSELDFKYGEGQVKLSELDLKSRGGQLELFGLDLKSTRDN
ncbi:hypothetical protein DB32_001098 [Sandaracinus amylolyticus]|uniref:Uncharacterized protein n=1 Tax=Sandaracinus amylolyticus TaxID=927083 RepID=A0A0F6SDS4_9BACT|nr:hypothetical protein DB32_001098 [Sandaracinus amylolyticus]